MELGKIKDAIQQLISVNQQRKTKYYRNLSLYEGTPRIALENIKNPSVVGLYSNIDEVNEDTTGTPNLNVIKSCIDTLHSKIAQSKVRPYFNCVNGSFKDIQVCKQSQQFFDLFFDKEDVNKKVSDAFKDACIFDTGYVFIDDDNRAISRALPYQVFEFPAEYTYNNVTQTYYERKDYPVSLLPNFLKAEVKKATKLDYVTYGLYYNSAEHIKCYVIKELSIYKIVSYEGNRTPFIRLFYNTPIASLSSCSVVDILAKIQEQINILANKIKDASQLNPAQTFFLPRGSGIKTGQLNNRVGNIVEYDVTSSMTGSPVTVATPGFIDPSYMQLLDDLLTKAYELTGVSMLSAQSKKPAGLDSGVALSTMEDVESERFETQLNQVIRAYVEIAKTCLKVFPKNELILPASITRMSITWADIVEEADKMQIQFSSASSLSKDPSEKLKQLIALASANVIPQSRIAQFMELPDLQGGFSLTNNAINAVLSVISDCIEHDNFDIPEYIPIPMLQDEILNTQLSLRAANYQLNKANIDKLSVLYAKSFEVEKTLEESAMQGEQAANIGDAVHDQLVQEVGQQMMNEEEQPESV